MLNRRDFLGLALGAGASLALAPELLGTVGQPGGALIQRAIPSSGEKLPVIGLGRGWARSLEPAAIKEVIRTLIDGGGSVVDTVHAGPPVRGLVGTVVEELEVQDKIFWSTAVHVASDAPAPGYGSPTPKVDPAAVKAEAEAAFGMLRVPEIDLMQVISLSDVATHLAVLAEMKKEGRVRYIGVSTLIPLTPDHRAAEFSRLESIMRNEPIDFISIDYGIDQREVEKTILPLAQERRSGS